MLLFNHLVEKDESKCSVEGVGGGGGSLYHNGS